MNKTTKHTYGQTKEIIKVDAAGISVGRLATQVAGILMGKNKVTYSRQVDCGDVVEISNVDKIKWTGRKFEQKKYLHHSGYPGGLKTTKASDVFKKNPAEIFTRTVFNMLPQNRLRGNLMKRIKFV